MEQKIRVLLADSDSEFCARMAAALENAGDMELVGIAEDGAKALAAVGELRPELLIIDLVLPVMDGITVLSRLREQGQTSLVTVALSAFASPQARLMEVEVCPTVKWSCSLSSGLLYPDTSL